LYGEAKGQENPSVNLEQHSEQDIFKAAIRIGSPAERIAYVRQACGADAALCARLEILLRAHDDAGDFLEGGPFGPADALSLSPVAEGPGSIIGRYKLLEKIGEGGMAVVYMAEQTEPIRRKVALKIIKLGMDTRQVIARFEAERQALALMDHPSIAKVLDAGATETGRPYFVMELVQGVSITEYCDKNNLSTKDRLALFLQVCQAVQHAHQKGIIHRDIKPSNVMVTHHDGRPVPKVIDFGIAKATNQRLTEKTLFTRYAHIIGTPAYMSPEQAELSDLDIDTRTDIYSLGVLLYELLTGTTPFSEEELRQAGYLEMQRVIREQEPAKPSTKLGTLGDTLTDIAKHRGCTPDLLRKAVRGDLDWIVMKSLEKDRARRYETPNALASDILRHLEHEPVLARGPSTTYRLQKLLRKHRSGVLMGVGITVVVAAAVVILSLWNRDRLQLVEAEGLRHKAILSQAREQYAKADREAALATLQPILDSRHIGPEAKLLQAGILVDNHRSDEAASILNGLLNDRPEVAGAAHSLLARVLWESGSSDTAKLAEVDEHRRQAEALLPEMAEAYFLRAMTAMTIKEKITLLDHVLRLDPSHYESRRLRAFTYYASRKYEMMKEDALGLVILRPQDPLGYSLRGTALRALGVYEEAIECYDSAIRLTPRDNPQHMELSAQRCEALMAMGEYERVITGAQECLRLWPNETVLCFHIFCALTALGDYDEASALFGGTTNSDGEARDKFRDWSMKYVADALEAGRPWHPPQAKPRGVAFLPMVQAEETYHRLSAKARRVIADGFTAHWSPDGSKLAFSMGFHGYSGAATYDLTTGETDLLIVPGKDPVWSPDGRYFAFVRDCQALPLAEYAGAERISRHRAHADEEIWIMNSDGTEPRRLTTGGWPSWSQDGKSIYYHSRTDNMLCRISIEAGDAQPQPILACSNRLPAVSPDGAYVAYVGGKGLTIVELASKSVVAEWAPPPDFEIFGGFGWSASGHELCLGGGRFPEINAGVWIYDLKRKQARKILHVLVNAVSSSSDGRQLVFNLGEPYSEVWVAELDPNVPITEALGPGRTLEEHYQEMVDAYTRRIETAPENADSYFLRAQYYERLHDTDGCCTDMARYIALSRQSGEPDDLQFGDPENLGPAVNTPADEWQPLPSTDGLSLWFQRRNAEGKAECWCATRETNDEPWGTPERVMSPRPDTSLAGVTTADGLELYSYGPGEYGRGDIFVRKRQTTSNDWGDPVNLGPVVNSPAIEMSPAVSPDGLELYFSDFYTALRPGGHGESDLWVTRRATRDDAWSEPVNLGPAINSPTYDSRPSFSSDGLVLFFDSRRPGGCGGPDIWMMRRAAIDAPWDEPVNLGPVVNSPAAEYFPHLSADGSILYYDSNRPGGYGVFDIWQVSVVSLGDGLTCDMSVSMSGAPGKGRRSD
jgi:serine/threonine protein kinase/Tol biopolymer transport system component